MSGIAIYKDTEAVQILAAQARGEHVETDKVENAQK